MNLTIKVSRPMVKVLNHYLQESGIVFHYREMGVRDYTVNVTYNASRCSADYSEKKNKFRVIEVEYPADYYACPAYLTTAELLRIWKSCTDKTIFELIDRIEEAVAI